MPEYLTIFQLTNFQVDLNLLSSQDQEVHPVTPNRAKKSITDSSGVSSGQLSETETLSSHSSVVQASSLVSQ